MVNGWIRFLKSQDSKKCYGIFKGNQQVEQHQQKQNGIIQHMSLKEVEERRKETDRQVRQYNSKSKAKAKKFVNSRSEPDNLDILSGELQKLIYSTPMNKIQQALVKMGYKGRMQTNKMLLNLQLLQNFRTSKQINELINELK